MATAGQSSTGLVVWHEPYLQLGDAPLHGFPGSDLDRIQVRWQTRSGGDAGADRFEVEFRIEGDGEWTTASPIVAEPLGSDTRVAHHVDLVGLEWDTRYEYRVLHLRDDSLFASYQGAFTTRLAPDDPAPFTFAAYGDSAGMCCLESFGSVQSAIADSNAAFALLLGDNSYENGDRGAIDARFRSHLSSEAADWRAGHIDYAAYGNHDVRAQDGAASEEAFAVPVQVARITAPAAPPADQRLGHNYSFDHGSVHFLTFDSNVFGDTDRLESLVEWISADLAASDARWKVVFAHHPVAGAPDKPESPTGDYYRVLVEALADGGADLLLVGHSHTFAWSYPLQGVAGAQAAFVRDTDGSFRQGDGVIQVVAGVGGRALRGGSFGGYPFVAAGFSQDSDPPSEWGFARIDVTPDVLTVSYVAASDREIIGSFTLHRRLVVLGGWSLAGPVAA